ncbi:MAG: ester cyclase [Flavobacteriales bacterium]|nr:ester cyclase [Flavobacteriales bacterium]
MKTTTFFLAISAITFLGACNSGPSPEQKALADKEAINKAAFEKFGEAWAKKDKAALSEVLADNFMTHNPDPSIPSTGKQHILDQVDAYYGMSSDMAGDPKLMMVDGDWVAGVVMAKGTNDGAMGEMPATGKKWEATAVDFMRFENGKIVEHWGVFDAMTMMQQLGMFDHHDDIAMDKEHVCSDKCKGDKHLYAHGEKGHECAEECKKVMESKV